MYELHVSFEVSIFPYTSHVSAAGFAVMTIINYNYNHCIYLSLNGKGLLYMQKCFKCYILYTFHTLNNGVVLLKHPCQQYKGRQPLKDCDIKMIQAIVADTEEQRHSCKPFTFWECFKCSSGSQRGLRAQSSSSSLCQWWPAIVHSDH